MARVHWAAIVVGVAICSCAFATEDPQSGKGIGIQEAWILNGKARVNTLPYDGPSIDSLRLAATAAIAHYSSFVQNGLVAQNATCGATFLSPHFAVTAAHCVDGVIDGPWNDPGEFFVDHIDVSSVNTSQVHAQGTVTGSWPDWTAGNSVSPPSGYLRRRTTCRVRCGRTPSFTACTSGTATQDMALIECPDRDPAFEPYWVYAGNTTPLVGDQVQSFWFHEVLDLPTTGTLSNERWSRYGAYVDFDTNPTDPGYGTLFEDNFHYTWPHLLWPLISERNQTGGLATVTATTSSSVSTNLFGCHGMSGAGVFARGSSVVFGPAVTGVTSGLCNHPVNSISPQLTNQLQSMSIVANDRVGNYTPSF